MTVEHYKIHTPEEWLAWRAQDLTASDVGAAAGVDPFKTALQLYGEKSGQLMAGGDNDLMKRGRWLEPAVIEAIHDENPDWRITRPRVYVRDPQLRLGATPDALVQKGEDELAYNCQCKVVTPGAFERHWSDGPPIAYQLQTLTEGMLLERPSMIAALVVFPYSAELHLYDVPRHPAAEARIRQIATEFWENMASGRRPAVDTTRDAETVAAMFPQSVSEPVLDLTGDNRMPDLLAARTMLKNEVSDIERQLKVIDTDIKAKLGTHEKAVLPGWKISWKTHTRAEHFVAETTARPLLVTDLRDEQEQAA